jgi:hypothetical protein
VCTQQKGVHAKMKLWESFTPESKRHDTIKTKLLECCYTCAARAKVAVDMSCVLHLARVVVVPALRRSFVRPTLFAVGRYKR